VKVEIKITPEALHELSHLTDRVNELNHLTDRANEPNISADVLDRALISYITNKQAGRFPLKHCNRWVRVVSWGNR